MRSRTGGAGAIETPTPGAVPDFIPVVGRYRTPATWRLSFHCGMNAAETSACRGIRIGCVSAPRRDAVRTSPRSWPGTTRRLRTDRSTAWLAGRFQSREGLTHDPAAALGQRDQILTEPVFNRCAARLASRAERSAWSWTLTLEIRPNLENDEIADWRRRGHRDADARRGARFYPGRWALPHHRDMAPFIPLWNECRRHCGLAGHTYRLRIGTSA